MCVARRLPLKFVGALTVAFFMIYEVCILHFIAAIQGYSRQGQIQRASPLPQIRDIGSVTREWMPQCINLFQFAILLFGVLLRNFVVLSSWLKQNRDGIVDAIEHLHAFSNPEDAYEKMLELVQGIAGNRLIVYRHLSYRPIGSFEPESYNK